MSYFQRHNPGGAIYTTTFDTFDILSRKQLHYVLVRKITKLNGTVVKVLLI